MPHLDNQSTPPFYHIQSDKMSARNPLSSHSRPVSQPIRSLLNNHQELRTLLDKAQVLSDLHRQFASVVPSHIALSTQILGLQFGTLSIAAANATLAAKLRQIAPDLVTQLQRNGYEISAIRVKVQVSFDKPQPQITPHKLSRTAQRKLGELSLKLEDTPLKHALEKLGKNY